MTPEDLQNNQDALRLILEDFDKIWTRYEQCYVFELMVIEQDARRFIADAIELEKKITEMEEREKGKITLRTNEAFISLKRDFINKISEINAIANTQGKGRDDLSIEIMLHAE
jgi:hypothetical protein